MLQIIIQAKVGADVEYFVADESEIVRAIEAIIRETSKENINELFSVSETVSTDKLVKEILEYAVAASASDIHIEPAETVLRLGYGWMGFCNFTEFYLEICLNRLTNVFFHLSTIQASDFLQFHDNRFDFEFLGHRMDVRLSHLPGGSGSGLVFKTFRPKSVGKIFTKLGVRSRNTGIYYLRR